MSKERPIRLFEQKRRKLMEFWMEDYPECDKRRYLDAFMRFSWRVYAHQNT